MSYQVIARKYRPQRFADVVGQEHVSTTLANAIAAGRIAHAYLFCGPRGTGKTTLARIFAKALNCTGGPTADFDVTDSKCVEIAEGRSLDVLEIDGVEQVRELRDTCKFSPASSKFKVYIIDEVHMLSTAAFNALLKTLEEPPAHVKFMFATTDPEKVLPTILSRCQRFDLRRGRRQGRTHGSLGLGQGLFLWNSKQFVGLFTLFPFERHDALWRTSGEMRGFLADFTNHVPLVNPSVCGRAAVALRKIYKGNNVNSPNSL